ncbi:MAG: ABC transporter ATP-binding protein, partial [Acidimicrobiia bacterium]|nr:ABC transporter ATP-binding protein [Acidimicrobiia bacterium]
MLVAILKTHLAPYKRWIAVIVGFQFVATIASLLLPSLNADIIDKGVVTGDTAYILRLGAVMLAVSLVQVVCSIVAVYFSAKTSMGFGRDLRSAVFRRVGTFSSREVSSFGAPSLITRNTNDVQQIQMLVMMSFTLMVMAPIMMVGGIVMALREDVGLSWLVAVAVPVLAVSLAVIITRMIPAYRIMQRRIDTVNRVLREQLTGIRVLRAFVREPYETERFGKANRDLTDVSLTVGRWMAAMFPIVMLILNLATVAVLWFGGHRIDIGAMGIGSMTAYLT